MKTKLTLLTLLAGLLAGPALAQDNAPKPDAPGGRGSGRGGPGGPGGGRFQPSAEEVKKYDKDGNGELSREEMRAMFEERRKELEKKYDANGDGKLDEEERKKLEAENPRPTGRGGPGGGQPTAEEIKTHDKNSDGKLDGEEVTALREARRKAMMEKYDTDKNGELSDEERAKMFQDRGARPGSDRPSRPGSGEGKPDAPAPEAPKVPVPAKE